MAAHPTFPRVIIGRKDGIAITCQGTYTGDVIPQVPNIHSGQKMQNILIKVCLSVNGPETVCVIRTIKRPPRPSGSHVACSRDTVKPNGHVDVALGGRGLPQWCVIYANDNQEPVLARDVKRNAHPTQRQLALHYFKEPTCSGRSARYHRAAKWAASNAQTRGHRTHSLDGRCE